jgi:hypothetical protein
MPLDVSRNFMMVSFLIHEERDASFPVMLFENEDTERLRFSGR